MVYLFAEVMIIVKKRLVIQSKIVLFSVLVTLAVTGCAKREVRLTNTGFLSTYSDLHEDEEFKGMSVYKNPDVDIGARYSKILIAPMQFKLDPTLEAHQIKDEDREKLVDYFYKKLKKRLKKNFEIVDEPQEDTLLFRAAITDILPNKVHLNLHYSTTVYGAGIGGASIEAELVDSLTGVRVMAFIDARKGRRLNYTKGLTKWGHTKEVLGIWAKIIVRHLDQLKKDYRAGR